MSLRDPYPFLELGGCAFRVDDIQIVFPLPLLRDSTQQRCRIYTRTPHQSIDVAEAYDSVMRKLESWYKDRGPVMRELGEKQ